MIKSYHFGVINIDGKVYRSDIIVFPDRINSKWWRESGHRLSERDLEEVFDFNPQTLVIGTGASGLMKVTQSLKKKLEYEKIEYIIKKTPEAVEEYNRISKINRAAGAFHITC